TELLRVHPQLSGHLGVSMRQVMAFARIDPGLRCRIELGCLFGHWDEFSFGKHSRTPSAGLIAKSLRPELVPMEEQDASTSPVVLFRSNLNYSQTLAQRFSAFCAMAHGSAACAALAGTQGYAGRKTSVHRATVHRKPTTSRTHHRERAQARGDPSTIRHSRLATQGPREC